MPRRHPDLCSETVPRLPIDAGLPRFETGGVDPDGGPGPLVSVVTPFYNTAAYLGECIERVLAQSYTNFEYILLDNQSTDNGRAIAEGYAARDPRIRVHTTDRFLPQIENYNAALRLISPASRFVKIAQADDVLFPECLDQMVRVAAAHPRVGVVSAFMLRALKVRFDHYDFADNVVPGRAVIRARLLYDRNYFGSPTTVLLRADLVRGRDPFFEPGDMHADTWACLDILMEWDFGFVSQVLTLERIRPESITGHLDEIDPGWTLIGHVVGVRRYGPQVLTPAEMAACWKTTEREYLKGLAAALVRPHRKAVWAHHEERWHAVGYRPPRLRLAVYMLGSLLAVLVSPRRLVAALRNRMRPARPVDEALGAAEPR
jgi:hypothetical protein